MTDQKIFARKTEDTKSYTKKIIKKKPTINPLSIKDSAGDTSVTQYSAVDEQRYVTLGFNPATSNNIANRTTTVVGRPVYNVYKADTTKPKVFAYYTDWSQYARNRDINTLDPRAYDKLIFGHCL